MSRVSDDLLDEIGVLVRRLHETQQRLHELTGGEVDAVVHPAGRSYLLHDAQEKLRQSETMQRGLAATQAAILSALPAHVALIDAEGKILAVNDGWRHFGEQSGLQDREACVGQNYLDICARSGGDGRAAVSGIRAVLKGEETEFAFEYPCHSTRERRWFRLLVSRLADNSGAVIMHVNITDRKLAEDAIRMQAHLLDQIGQAVIATDIDGRVTYANRYAQELYGWPHGELVGRSIVEVTVPHPSREQAEEIMVRLREGQNWSGELMVQSRDGRVFPALVTDSPLLDDHGNVTGMVGISTDISAPRLAAEALLKSEREQRQLAHQLEAERERLVAAQAVAKVGSWETDLETMDVRWSEETHRIFETDPATFHPTHEGFLALVHHEDRDRVDRAFRQSFDAREARSIEHRIVMPDNREKLVEERWRVIHDENGTAVRAVGTCQDITERKRLENQFLRAQRMESVGTLAGGIAHDLNNILAPILMSIEMLAELISDDEGRMVLATLQESAERGADLVRQVLSFARGVEGKRDVVNPLTLMENLLKVVRETFPKSIDVRFTPSRDLWTVTGDQTQLHQVFLNLCVNARDAMSTQGSLTISMENEVLDETYAGMNPDSSPGAYVVVTVSDTGCGIPAPIRDKIFEPFFTTKEIGKGTGLGLSTSMAIVRSHGGFIHCYSELGRGARFKVFLPANVDQIAAERVAVEETRLPRGSGELVLVVDDERAIREVAKRTLERYGYRVMLAAHGAEAVSLYAQHEADIAVVVTDMAMPIMDGPATVLALKAMNPSVRIIGSSGLTSNHVVADVASRGVLGFVSKPYTAEALLSSLHNVLHPSPG